MIGVFNAMDICCGMLEVTDTKSPMGLTAFGDDITTENLMDGLNENETMTFRLYRPETGREYRMNVVFDTRLPDLGHYKTNGLSKISSIALIPEAVENNSSGEFVHVYPNPSHGIFYVSFSQPVQDIDLSVFDDNGQLLLRKKLNEGQKNNYSVINLNEYPKGIYFIRFIKDKFIEYYKIIIQ